MKNHLIPKILLVLLFWITFFQMTSYSKDQNDKNSQGDVAGKSAPQVVYGVPGYFFHDVTQISSIQITFGAPVNGVKAKDVLVNGNYAQKVTGQGPGPYLFTGFIIPPPGKVEIVVDAGEIKRDPSGTPFEGFSWIVRLFDPQGDEDGDQLSNAEEVEGLTNPIKADSDGDDLPDRYEINHSCLDPRINESKPRNDYGTITPGNDDADGDGLSNFDEYKKGSDPCKSD